MERDLKEKKKELSSRADSFLLFYLTGPVVSQTVKGYRQSGPLEHVNPGIAD